MTFVRSDLVSATAKEAAARGGATDENPGERLAFVIMVEPGYLEYQSMLLTMSFLDKCTSGFKIYPYCRDDRIDQLQPEIRDYYDMVSDGVKGISPAFETEYAHGNKIYAMAAERPEKNTLFMDSDTLLIAETDFNPVIRDGGVSVIQGTVTGWSNEDDHWLHLYRVAGLKQPPMMLQHRFEGLAYPYYNGGFVLSTVPGFGDVWRDLALKIDVDDTVPDRRPWLDQITLPLAIAAIGAQTCVLSSHWNGFRSRQNAIKQNCRVIHYHMVKKAVEAGFEDDFSRLVARFTEYSSFYEFVQGLAAKDYKFFKTDQVTRMLGKGINFPRYIDKVFHDGRLAGGRPKVGDTKLRINPNQPKPN